MEKNKNNLIAIVIGMALIIIIGSITFLRPYLNNRKELSALEELKKIDEEKIKKITAEEVTQMISNQIKLNIIDLRNPAEFSREHIIGSINPSDEELASLLAEIDKNQVYILVEKSGDQVGKNLLKEMDYPTFFLYLEGGFDNWKRSAYPTLSSGDVDSFVDQSKVKHISIEAFKKLKESSSPFFLIDLRAKEQYEKEKLEGSSNFPLEELEKRRFEVPSSRTIILYGENALDSFQGAVRLFDLGFFNVQTFKENFSALKSQGL